MEIMITDESNIIREATSQATSRNKFVSENQWLLTNIY